MRHQLIAGDDHVLVSSFEIGRSDVVEMGVRPVQSFREVVDREAVGPRDVVFVRQDSSEVRTIHADLTDVRLMRTIFML